MTRRTVPFVAIVFTVAFAVAYLVAVWNNYALFTYHPSLGTVAWGVEKPRDGPAMYWYGWISTGLIAAAAACLVAALVPERFAQRVWSGLTWTAPIVVLVLFAYLLRGYFLR